MIFRNPRVAIWGRKHYKTGRSSKNMRLGDGIGLISETSTSKLDISSGLAKTQSLLVLVSGPRHGPGKIKCLLVFVSEFQSTPAQMQGLLVFGYVCLRLVYFWTVKI